MTTTRDVRGVEVLHWNPRHRPQRGKPVEWRRLGRRKNNFGDLLGPWIVAELAAGLPPASRRARVVAVGSIMHLARPGDVVWGTGINGKIARSAVPTGLDVRAVRGPLTREVLIGLGIAVPPVYGDPALLLPRLRPDLVALAAAGPVREHLVVPNLNDRGGAELRGLEPEVLDPTRPVEDCLRAIVTSASVVSSSLHGLVIAEAFGIPAVPVRSGQEDDFKYRDYVLGSGRRDYRPAPDFCAGLRGTPMPSPQWDPQPLLDAFPRDLWTGAATVADVVPEREPNVR